MNSLSVVKYSIHSIPHELEQTLNFGFVVREGFYFLLYLEETNQNRKLVGGCLLIHNPDRKRVATVLYIEIFEKWRNLGFGRCLLKSVLCSLNEMELERVELVNEAGEIGDRLYWSMKKSGFKVWLQKRNKRWTEEKFIFSKSLPQ